ncbi:alpha-ketoglutarate-dependent taurine dioxygenase [Streptacidiphilus sp. MAP12-33]|uniref:TauD/TfdA dioxygenase family protein n=1 Tax=Streptacidiphilus sp. MAP12-33 TaxID=3156266 RepID=UPI0035153B43
MTDTDVTARAPYRVAFAELDPNALRAELEERGYLYIDEVPEGFDHAAFVSEHLGPLLPQWDGVTTIWSIKPEAGFEESYHSNNTKKLTPHTECFEWEGVPPKYLGLWCLVPNADQGGQTTLTDGFGFLASLTEAERERLRTQVYQFVSTPGLQQLDMGLTAAHPVLEERAGSGPILRFSCRCIADVDEFCRSVSHRVQEYFEAHKIEVEFSERSLLLWDNHRFLHSRNAFQDTRRHLQRVWVAEQ